MDWKLFGATFLTIFLAEFGDKTQLAAIAASSQTRSTLTVLLASCLALCFAAVLGVIAGKYLHDFISPKILQMVAGSAFIGMGIWMLFFRS